MIFLLAEVPPQHGGRAPRSPVRVVGLVAGSQRSQVGVRLALVTVHHFAYSHPSERVMLRHMEDDRAQIVDVDERDSRWELRDPTFRIYVQSARGENESASTSTYDVSGVDVEAAIRLARRLAKPDEHVAIALVQDFTEDALKQHPGRGLVWLLGEDQNENR